MRIREMAESSKILRQALRRFRAGPVLAKVARNFKPPAGECQIRLESGRGDMGWYVVSDGTGYPWRVHVRTGSFAAMGIIQKLSAGLDDRGPGHANREPRRDRAGDRSLILDGDAGKKSDRVGRVRQERVAGHGRGDRRVRDERGGLSRRRVSVCRNRELGRAARVGANPVARRSKPRRPAGFSAVAGGRRQTRLQGRHHPRRIRRAACSRWRRTS